MGDREKLHDLRQQAHDAGIEGNSTMTEEQLHSPRDRQGRATQMAKCTRPSGNERGRHRHLSRVGTAQTASAYAVAWA
ncbi:hypothetical protein GA0070560_114136 [Micromonospora halophytica]|uniref:Uncharacterized protein n=1 Tax=Micromonospora halophytica TaxID=47864 RepID=A0A1C5IPL2_9ACTN|nr:hypothetical protein GA0070560_114136 [Micromonospora halophytica]